MRDGKRLRDAPRYFNARPLYALGLGNKACEGVGIDTGWYSECCHLFTYSTSEYQWLFVIEDENNQQRFSGIGPCIFYPPGVHPMQIDMEGHEPV